MFYSMQKVWERSMDEQLTPDAWASIWKNKNKITNSVRITSVLFHSLNDPYSVVWQFIEGTMSYFFFLLA